MRDTTIFERGETPARIQDARAQVARAGSASTGGARAQQPLSSQQPLPSQQPLSSASTQDTAPSVSDAPSLHPIFTECKCPHHHKRVCRISGPNELRHRAHVCLHCGRLQLTGEISKALTSSLPAAAQSDPLASLCGLDFREPSVLVAGVVIRKSAGQPAERWITVHPNGDAGPGQPIKIVQNHDKSWSVHGGAGGKLNGLRLDHVKSPEEYRHLAKQRQKEKRDARDKKQQETHRANVAAHAKTVQEEARKQGQTLTPQQIQHAAHLRAREQAASEEEERKAQIEDARKARHESEKSLIAAVAKTQGWDEAALALTPEQKHDARVRALQQAQDMDADDREAYAEKMVARLEKAHHEKLLQAAHAVRQATADLILDTHEAANADAMGELAVGDLVRQTLGDSGKGYVANLEAEALRRGMDLSALQEEAARLSAQSRLERNDFSPVAASAAYERAQRAQAAAAQTRANVQELQESDNALNALSSLDTTPRAATLSDAAALLTQAQEHAAQAREYSAREREARDGGPSGGAPAEKLARGAAVIEGAETSRADAMKQVVHDLEERRRQRAMGALMSDFNDADAQSPLVSHRLNGHAAVFGNVGHLAGVRAPDPLMSDILGPHVAAALMRRALENVATSDPARLDGLREALAAQHVDTQVEAARTAIASAKALREKAASLVDPPLDSEEGLACALENNELRLELTQKAREQLGQCVGRLEAAAALNEILGRGQSPSEMQVNLGGLSMEEAQLRAKVLGLSKADTHDENGALVEAGQYHIHHDGQNAILILHETGLARLAAGLHENPEHLERARVLSAIKSGAEDERGWLPAGFSDRPRLKGSRDDAPPLPSPSTPLDLRAVPEGDEGALQRAVHDYIGARLESGHDPIHIAADMRSAAFRANHVPSTHEAAYLAELERLAPANPRNADGTRLEAAQKKKFVQDVRTRMGALHGDWLKRQVEAGALSSEAASVHRQTLSPDWKTRDGLYQAALQDPRLQHAFTDVGELSTQARRALRDYAAEHLFEKTDPNEPNKPLSPVERRAWDGWRALEKEALDPYQAIQNHWKEKDESAGGGMFGDAAEPHAFATVDLNDDAAVLQAARAHGRELGFEPLREVLDANAGTYRDTITELEPSATRSEKTCAGEARKRIRKALRDHAFKHMFGASDLVGGAFNPANVESGAGDRWAEYVAHMGHEAHAYHSVQEVMKGDFAGRFAKIHNEWIDHDANAGGANAQNASTRFADASANGETRQRIQTVAVPLTYSDSHTRALLSPAARLELDREKAAQQAKVRDRAGGKFAAEGAGAVAAKLEAKQDAQKLGGALFGDDEVQTDSEKAAQHRLSLGSAAESTIASMMPYLGTTRGTIAAGDIDMSSETGIKRQRAVKQVLAAKRHALTLSAGAGKTSCALALHGELKAKNPQHRTLMAVPSAVQAQFGSEAARFYDPTSDSAPRWHAQPGLSASERRASYHKDSGYDINVVTHQALRDDLTWALAQHRFGGDEERAGAWLKDAPEEERNAAVRAACDAQGWEHRLTIVDEGHGLLNRDGKPDSAMANAIDAFTASKEFHCPLSADPIKNGDASEAFDLLRKVAPHRYVNDDHPQSGTPGVVSHADFMRKYGTNIEGTREALQREMEPYHYAESVTPDVERTDLRHTLDLTPDQRTAYTRVQQLYRRARTGRRSGCPDVEALKELSPASFEDEDGTPHDGSTHEATARRLQSNLGILRDSALDRVVNLHDNGAKMQKLDAMLKENPPRDKPHVIFAHNLDAVEAIHKHLSAQGYRVGKMRGDMDGAAKDAVKNGFSPPWDSAEKRYVAEPEYDVLVCSDCASTGLNMQRGQHLTHWDTPHTAMTFQQRAARIHRTGQESDVTIHHLTTETPYERARLANLERKNAMREALTTPSEKLDDSGLAFRIARETDNARARLIGQSVQALDTARAGGS